MASKHETTKKGKCIADFHPEEHATNVVIQ